MRKKEEKKEEKRIETIREPEQVIEEEVDGAGLEEDRPETMKKENIAKEEAEEDINQEVEEASEEEDEVFVGRTLLPLPRRCLRLGQEAKPKQ